MVQQCQGWVLQAKDTSSDRRLAGVLADLLLDGDGGLPNQGKPNVHVPGDVDEVGDTTGKQLDLLLQDAQVKGSLLHILYRN